MCVYACVFVRMHANVHVCWVLISLCVLSALYGFEIISLRERERERERERDRQTDRQTDRATERGLVALL